MNRIIGYIIPALLLLSFCGCGRHDEVSDYQFANIETGTGGIIRKFAQSQIISIYIFE